MGPTTTSFVPHNKSSKQQQKRPKNAQSLYPNNSLLEQRNGSALIQDDLQKGSWVEAMLASISSGAEISWLHIVFLSKASCQTHIANLI